MLITDIKDWAKKVSLAFLVFALAIILTNTGQATAATTGTCSYYDSYGTLVTCRYLTLSTTDVSAGSSAIYFEQGDLIYYDWQNSGSKHSVGFAVKVTSDSSQVYGLKTAGAGNGNNYGYMYAPSNGWYYLAASCGGGQTGCSGTGKIQTDFP